MVAPGDATPSPHGPRRKRPRRAPRCAACDYSPANLYGDSLCPECGAPAWHSAYGSLLTMRWPPLIRRMRLGAGLLMWGLVALVALSLLQFGIYRALQTPNTDVRITWIPATTSGGDPQSVFRWSDGRVIQISQSSNGAVEILRLWDGASPRRTLVRADGSIEYDTVPTQAQPAPQTPKHRLLTWLGTVTGHGQQVTVDRHDWLPNAALLRDGSIGWRGEDRLNAVRHIREIRVDSSGVVRTTSFPSPNPYTLGFTAWRAGIGGIDRTRPQPFGASLQGLRAIAGGCVLLGVWLVAAREREKAPKPRRTLAWLARIATLLGGAAWVSRLVLFELLPLRYATHGLHWSWATSWWIWQIIAWTFPIAVLAMLLYLRVVFRSMSRPRLGVAALTLVAACIGLLLRKPIAFALADDDKWMAHMIEFEVSMLIDGTNALVTFCAIILLALLRKALIAPAETVLARAGVNAPPRSPA